MLGPVSQQHAMIWVQGNTPATVALEVQKQDASGSAWCTMPVRLESESEFIATFELDSLDAGTEYRYWLVWNGERLEPAYRFRTLDTPSAYDFKVYLGSCSHLHDPVTDGPKSWSGDYGIYDAIADQADADTLPHLMLWLGDNLYLRPSDYSSPSGMAQRYRKARSHPALQKLLPAMPHYAIWDDHDYGPNNSTRHFAHKATSMELFRRYWPNLNEALPAVHGIFYSYVIADTEFFLLDSRWYRERDKDEGDNKVLYGPAQLAWLKSALLNSTAHFKLIGGGSQFLNDYQRFEGWQNFRQERGEFLSWLRENDISGVLLLSGDRHHTEMLRLDRPGTYPLYELTCSPLTAGTYRVEASEENNPLRLPGTLVESHNYCTLEVEGTGNARKLVLKSLAPQGEVLWKVMIEADALK